jgi:hypothetical protein
MGWFFRVVLSPFLGSLGFYFTVIYKLYGVEIDFFYFYTR